MRSADRAKGFPGWNLTIGPEAAGGHRIRLSRGILFKRRKQWVATTHEVDVLEQSLLEQLRKLRNRKSIKMKMDFYGNQWMEVPNGIFGTNYLRIPSERLMRLADALKIS